MAFFVDPLWWILFVAANVIAFLMGRQVHNWMFWYDFYSRQMKHVLKLLERHKQILSLTKYTPLLFFPWLGLLAVMVVFSGYLPALFGFSFSSAIFFVFYYREIRHKRWLDRIKEEYQMGERRREGEKRKEQEKQQEEKRVREQKQEEQKTIGSKELLEKAIKQKNMIAYYVLTDDISLERLSSEMDSLIDEGKISVAETNLFLAQHTAHLAWALAMEEKIQDRPEFKEMIDKYSVEEKELNGYLVMLGFSGYNIKDVALNKDAFEAFFSNVETLGYESAFIEATRVLGDPPG